MRNSIDIIMLSGPHNDAAVSDTSLYYLKKLHNAGVPVVVAFEHPCSDDAQACYDMHLKSTQQHKYNMKKLGINLSSYQLLDKHTKQLQFNYAKNNHFEQELSILKHIHKMPVEDSNKIYCNMVNFSSNNNIILLLKFIIDNHIPFMGIDVSYNEIAAHIADFNKTGAGAVSSASRGIHKGMKLVKGLEKLPFYGHSVMLVLKMGTAHLGVVSAVVKEQLYCNRPKYLENTKVNIYCIEAYSEYIYDTFITKYVDKTAISTKEALQSQLPSSTKKFIKDEVIKVFLACDGLNATACTSPILDRLIIKSIAMNKAYDLLNCIQVDIKVGYNGECSTFITVADTKAVISKDNIDLEKIAEDLDFVTYNFYQNKER